MIVRTNPCICKKIQGVLSAFASSWDEDGTWVIPKLAVKVMGPTDDNHCTPFAGIIMVY